MALSRVNAVVIGAGAGGGVVAKELSSAGMTVALLERGKWHSANDDRKDDLYNQRTSVLGAPFGPEDDRNPRVLVDDRGEHLMQPSDGGYSNNAACVGGGTFSYGAMAWRFLPKDFKMRSTYGEVAGGTLDDWPISYDDLEPYYEKAEWEMGVSGDDTNNVFKGPRKKPLPMPPLAPSREHQLLDSAATRLGLHPFHIPMLRNTVPYNGRRSCMRCRWCVGFACEVNARTGTHNTVIPTALATGHCELRTNCMTKEILLDQHGRASGVSYFDADKRLQEQPADLVVVCCGAVESARLLLNSRHRLFPNGLGNRYDWVGRNFQGHTYCGANGLFDHDTYDDLGPGASIAICDYNHGNPGLAGGAMLANEFIRLPYQLLNLTPPAVPRWGQAHKQWVRNSFHRTVVVMGPVQEIPLFEARVEVDPKVRDYWGIPVARLSGKRHPHTIEIARFIAGRAEAWLKEAGAVETWKRIPGATLSGGQHQAGTCRMGNDPKTSVVDRNCRIHDVDNVYVVDASNHVTNGGFNPVLTILANAYRASDNLVATLKEGANMKRSILAGAVVLLGLLLMVPAASLYYEAGSGQGCTSCHEMNAVYDRWHGSSHRNIACEKCHGGALTTDVAFHWNNATRLVSHLKGDLPERIGFGNGYVQGMTERCRSCHQQEYAAWAAGPHSASYSRIFLDAKHNTKNMLMDDCLRCHGLHFEGGMGDLVTPVARQGPWRMVSEGAANMASMPCLTCHEMHREGPPLAKPSPDGRVPGLTQEKARPSLALFDRRTRHYVPVAELPVPVMLDGARQIKMSNDQRQALCYQCHAPTSNRQIGSGDDRTSMGVHEGISCLACHAQHGQRTRASCSTCHPKMSNCGLDVEQMDTTFKSATSKHNVHWVKCQDCHDKGIPKKKVLSQTALPNVSN